MKIKEGDNVVVISGKNKGAEGVVTKVNKVKNQVTVDGVNIVTKHNKPNQSNQEGGIEQKEGPIHISNVMIKEGKTASRIGYKIENDKKIRVMKKNKQELK